MAVGTFFDIQLSNSRITYVITEKEYLKEFNSRRLCETVRILLQFI